MTPQLAHAVLANKSKSFALAGRLLPTKCRDDAAVLYAWCRRADDAIDEGNPSEAGERLLALRAELELVYSGLTQRDPTLEGFQDLVRRHGIPIQHPQALLDGFAMDLGIVRFASVDELLLYAYRVAGVVGVMMCPVLGVHDKAAVRHAADLGIAMQLTNICRDVKEDWERGRLYIPTDVLAATGLDDVGDYLGQTLPAFARTGLPRAVRSVLDLADQYYASGDHGLSFLSARTAFAIRTARKVYAAIGTELQRRDCDALRGRVVVARRNKLKLVIFALIEELAMRLVRELDGALSFFAQRTSLANWRAALRSEGLRDETFAVGA
jgi:phytoene synthase